MYDLDEIEADDMLGELGFAGLKLASRAIAAPVVTVAPTATTRPAPRTVMTRTVAPRTMAKPATVVATTKPAPRTAARPRLGIVLTPELVQEVTGRAVRPPSLARTVTTPPGGKPAERPGRGRGPRQGDDWSARGLRLKDHGVVPELFAQYFAGQDLARIEFVSNTGEVIILEP